MEALMWITALYIVPVIIDFLYVKYDTGDTDGGRKVVLGCMWIPIINLGCTMSIIVTAAMRITASDRLYNFIRRKHKEKS